MAQLPSTNPGSEFEKSVVIRSWLSELPETPVPDGFEDAVLDRARGTTTGVSKLPWIISGLVFITIVTLVSFIVVQPKPVVVSYAPLSPLPAADLYDLKPMPVIEDLRFEKEPEPAVVPFGVAGY